MSGAITGLSVFAGIGQQALAASGLMPAFIRAPRSIGTIIPDVTIEEHFVDRATVTVHPVATGTQISDHMFLNPKQVTMRCGWSNSNIVGGLVQTLTSAVVSGQSLLDTGSNVLGLFTEERVKQVYQQLLKLQEDREPFTLTTGKRTYPQSAAPTSTLGKLLGSAFTSGTTSGSKPPGGNMVITELTATNDHKTEYALVIEVHMQEVILVDLGDTGPAPELQALPQTTASPADGGSQQPTPEDRSDLSNWTGWKERNPNPKVPAP